MRPWRQLPFASPTYVALHHMKVSSLAPKDHKVKDDKDHAISSRRAKKARARTRNFKASRAAKSRALD